MTVALSVAAALGLHGCTRGESGGQSTSAAPVNPPSAPKPPAPAPPRTAVHFIDYPSSHFRDQSLWRAYARVADEPEPSAFYVHEETAGAWWLAIKGTLINTDPFLYCPYLILSRFNATQLPGPDRGFRLEYLEPSIVPDSVDPKDDAECEKRFSFEEFLAARGSPFFEGDRLDWSTATSWSEDQSRIVFKGRGSVGPLPSFEFRLISH